MGMSDSLGRMLLVLNYGFSALIQLKFLYLGTTMAWAWFHYYLFSISNNLIGLSDHQLFLSSFLFTLSSFLPIHVGYPLVSRFSIQVPFSSYLSLPTFPLSLFLLFSLLVPLSSSLKEKNFYVLTLLFYLEDYCYYLNSMFQT